MSRTYRLKNHHEEKEALWYSGYNYYGEGEWEWVREYVGAHSKEGKRRIAEFHSDAKKRIMIWHGPSWFHRLYSQKPYRTRARRELHKFMRNPDHEVIIENKPPREYWW